MGRVLNLVSRTSLVGLVVLAAGSLMVAGVAVQQALSSPALADTAAFELFCSNTPIGDLAFNGVVATGSLSPSAPAPGQQFTLENFQLQIPIPANIVGEVGALESTINGTVTTTLTSSGATPATLPTGALAFSQPIPKQIPPSGGMLDVPTTPATLGPFTAQSADVSLSLGSPITESISNIATFVCSAYPDDSMPTGSVTGIPPGLPASPVIAYAGAPPPPPGNSVTGPYELYCPHTPVGDLVFNGVTTTADLTPSTISAGDQFEVTNYQTDIPIPSGVVSAAAGLGNTSFEGLAAGDVDAYGATPSQVATGSMAFDVAIPDPVPASSLPLDLPSSPATIGPFTATGGPITIAEDQSIELVAELSYKAFRMSCTAYPDDTVATSGPTGTPPPSTPIRPIVALSSASGTPVTTTTSPGPPVVGSQAPGAPYELYCPGTPVGDIAVNDVVTTGSIAPSSLNEGDQFQVDGLETQFSIPQGVAQQAENLGLTSLSGDLGLLLNVTGVEYGGFPGTGVGIASGSSGNSAPPSTTTVTAPPGSVPPPYPISFPGFYDLSFDVTLPNPVPATGVQFTASEASGSLPETFVAAGGPIEVSLDGVNLGLSAFGDQFQLFCDTLANDSVPTGLSAQQPDTFVAPVVTTASATTNPPPPAPVGSQGPYELFCPGTPVGEISFNNVDTTGTITPSEPASGEQFDLTGYQTTLTIPAAIANAAAALGGSDLSGNVTGSIDATGATPAQISTGALSFDVPLPNPVPPGGVSLTMPSNPATVGPFTASGGTITLAQDATVQLVVTVAGENLDLTCTAYPNDTLPSGLVSSFPSASATSPTIATTTSSSVPTTETTTPGAGTSPTQGTSPSGTSASGGTSPAGGSTSSAGASATSTAEAVEGASGGGAEAATASASDTSASGEPAAAGSPEAAGSSSPAPPPSGENPIASDSAAVSASPESLAFTGPGAWTGWIVVCGVVLIAFGLVMVFSSDVFGRRRRALLVARDVSRGGPAAAGASDGVNSPSPLLASRWLDQRPRGGRSNGSPWW